MLRNPPFNFVFVAINNGISPFLFRLLAFAIYILALLPTLARRRVFVDCVVIFLCVFFPSALSVGIVVVYVLHTLAIATVVARFFFSAFSTKIIVFGFVVYTAHSNSTRTI